MSINMGLSAPGWTGTINAVRALPREIKTEVSRRGRRLAEPLAREIRAEAASQGSHAAGVAPTVKAGMKAGIPSVKAGGKPYTMGAEFGGRIRRTTHYQTHRTTRTRYIVVQRRSTMQFRPHRGQEGYFFWPTIRDRSDVVLKPWRELVDDVIAGF